jgi:hypothetical protein
MDQMYEEEFQEPVDGLTELPPPVGEEEQEELVQKLSHEYGVFRRAVSDLHDRLDRWRLLYETSEKDSKDFPWPGAANFSAPVIMATVDSIHARIVKAVFDVDPLWLAKPRHADSVNKSKKAEKYLDYWADEMMLSKALDGLILNMLIEGVGVLKVDWVQRTRQIPEDPEVAAQEMDMALREGREPQPPGPQTVVEYAGPQGKHVPLKDFILIPADAPTIEEAVYTGHRVWLNHQQLLDRRDAGIYFNVDKLLSYKSGAGDKSTGSKGQHPSRLVNTSDTRDSKYEETNEYEVIEMYGPYDFGDGPTPALMAFNPEHECLLRLEPYPYQYGRPPYVDFCVYPRPNFFWGRSVPEMLESAQEEITAMHNMRADALSLRIASPILKRMGSQWDPEEIPWRPGAVIPINEPGDVSQLPLMDVPSSLFAHEQDTLAFVERVTGMSDYFMGRSPSQNRTATEVNRVTSEGLARIDVMVSRFQHGGMQKLSWVLWWLLYQYRPLMDYFQDETGAYQISKTEMRPTESGLMPFEFIPHGQLSDASKEARRQQFLTLLQVASGPLSQFYPDGIQQLLNEIFESFDIQQRHQILGPPWSVIQQQIQQAMQAGYQQGMQDAQQAQG